MDFKVGDLVTLATDEYEHWYRKNVPNGVWMFEHGDVCEIINIDLSDANNPRVGVQVISPDTHRGLDVHSMPAEFVHHIRPIGK